MQTIRSSFLAASSADATVKRLQVRLLQVVLAFIFFASLAFVIAILVGGGDFASLSGSLPPILTVLSLILFYVVGKQRLINTIGTFVVTYMFFVSMVLYSGPDSASLMFLLFTIISITGALISSRRVFQGISTILFITVLLVSLQVGDIEEASTLESATISLLTMAIGIIPIGIGAFSRYFIGQVIRTATDAQRTVSLLSASADIGNDVSHMLELTILLDRAVEIIRDRFAFYHVSIFLVDDNERYIHLTASTGEVGERMLARGHRLPISADSVVGRSAQAKEVIIARDTDSDSGHAFNELLPFTRSELAVPIIDNDGIVGVVDIQSRRIDAFTATEMDALRVIANQLATAIRNARLFEDKERSIRENKRLFIEAETNLREIQRLNRQLTKQAWTDYLQHDRRIDGVTLSDDLFRNTASWSEEMLDASRRRRAISNDKDGKRTIAVPIELRGEVVGAIELETEANAKKDDLVDMVRTVSQRLAVSLDNARLFEESNEATAQEQRVSEIVSQYQSAESVDELLRVTLQGLAETLGAEQASIRLGAVPDIAGIEIDTENPDPQTNGGKPDVS